MERSGRIEVICGGMFSGKTEELIRRLVRAKIAKQKILAFKASLDSRYHSDNISSHSGITIESIPVNADENGVKLIEEMVNSEKDVDVVGIDEVMFFHDSIVDLCDKLANRGIRVIVAGLDLDFKDEPFGPMNKLMPKADYVDKLKAVCMKCGSEATKTQLKQNILSDPNQVIIGGVDKYEARCRKCFEGIVVKRE